jgi:chromate transporter
MRERSALEVFLTFLKLGLTSFGGPAAHIGYFRQEIVVRRHWVDDAAYTDLVALCQFLPGPASSQVGFSLGLMRARYWGALAAWAGFTLPSAALMTALAYSVGEFNSPIGLGISHGLKLVAVAIVAQAVWGMAATLCPDRQRASIACVSAVITLFSNSSLAQIGVILLGGIAGFRVCRAPAPIVERPMGIVVSRRASLAALAAFLALLMVLPVLGTHSQGFALVDTFYRAGALVFGGGHVVLPLLNKAFVTPGWVSQDSFLAGYGAAQGLPGPLFTFAAYLGAVGNRSPQGIAGAALGIVGIFLPGMLLLLGTLPFWDIFRQRVGTQAIMRGVNAAVVGLLGAALYNPLWVSSVGSAGDFAIALTGFVLLTAWRASPLLVVILGALGGITLAQLG